MVRARRDRRSGREAHTLPLVALLGPLAAWTLARDRPGDYSLGSAVALRAVPDFPPSRASRIAC